MPLLQTDTPLHEKPESPTVHAQLNRAWGNYLTSLIKVTLKNPSLRRRLILTEKMNVNRNPRAIDQLLYQARSGT